MSLQLESGCFENAEGSARHSSSVDPKTHKGFQPKLYLRLIGGEETSPSGTKSCHLQNLQLDKLRRQQLRYHIENLFVIKYTKNECSACLYK